MLIRRTKHGANLVSVFYLAAVISVLYNFRPYAVVQAAVLSGSTNIFVGGKLRCLAEGRGQLTF